MFLRDFPVGFCHYKQDLKPWGIPRVHFLKSEWEEFKGRSHSISWQYLLWRSIYAVFCIFAVIFSFLSDTHPEFWFIYLTNWSLFTQLIYSILFFASNAITIITTRYKTTWRAKDRKADMRTESKDTMETTNEAVQLDRNTCVESFIWTMLGIAGTLPLFVTLGFWVAVYPALKTPLSALGWGNAIVVHGLNSAFALIDTMVMAIPVHVTQFVFFVGFGIIYVLFGFLYEKLNGHYRSAAEPYIYSVLNWRENPTQALTASLASLVAVVVLYLILWLLYVFRLYLVSKLSCRRDRDSCRDLHRYWAKNKPTGAADALTPVQISQSHSAASTIDQAEEENELPDEE